MASPSSKATLEAATHQNPEMILVQPVTERMFAENLLKILHSRNLFSPIPGPNDAAGLSTTWPNNVAQQRRRRGSGSSPHAQNDGQILAAARAGCGDQNHSCL
jgi:hypothetical protein